MTETFNVYQFFPDGSYEKVLEKVTAQEAVTVAASYTNRPAAVIGIIRKVMIDDSDGCCVFLWEFGKGVVFPPKRDCFSHSGDV